MSILGILLGTAAVFGGNILEGGKFSSMIQLTAAVIVFGGTAGATCISFPFSDIVRAASALSTIFLGSKPDHAAVVADLLRYASIARRTGFIALEPEIPAIGHPFLKKALRLAVDGMNLKVLRETLEEEISTYEAERRRIARVYETAGGFAPTIGIIGAVLGLIHVMENLSDPAKLGGGIAIAFVATIYGVGSANLVLLPMSKKLLHQLNQEVRFREMIIEGVAGIQTGLNPHYLEEHLNAFAEQRSRKAPAPN